MAKDDTPKEWTPDQPLEDAEDEEMVQRRFRASQRTAYLEAEAAKKKPPKGGGKSERKPLF